MADNNLHPAALTRGDLPGTWLLGGDLNEPVDPVELAEARDMANRADAGKRQEASKHRPRSKRPATFQHQHHQSLDDWLRVLPPLQRKGNEFYGPCPLCGEGVNRFAVKEARDGTVLLNCRKCKQRGMSDYDFFVAMLKMFFPRETFMSTPSSNRTLKPKTPENPYDGVPMRYDERLNEYFPILLPFKVEGNEPLPLRTPVAEDVRQLLEHLGLAIRWNSRANRIELKTETWDWFNYGDFDAMLHNALENVMYPVKDKKTEEVSYKARSISKDRMLRSLAGIAQENKVDPFLDYLEALPEPKTPIEEREGLAMRLLDTIFGVKPECKELAAYGVRNLLRAVIHRTLTPGYDYDDMLILKSPEGHGKSKTLKAILPDPAYFTDRFSLDLDPMKQTEKTFGKVIIESAELEGMTRAETAKLYAFLSSSSDTYRRPWGTVPVDIPRRWCVVGTTNKHAALNFPPEQSGRRYIYVELEDEPKMKSVPEILKYVASIRDKLWAEALWAVRNLDDGAPAWLPKKLTEQQTAINKQHLWTPDEATEAVDGYLERSNTDLNNISTVEVANWYYGNGHRNLKVESIAAALVARGFTCRRTKKGKRWSKDGQG